MTLRGIFFDLYGTLLVYGDMTAAWSEWFAALSDCLAKSGLRVEPARLQQHCEGFFTRPEPSAPRDGLSVYENRLLALYSELGLTPPADQIRHAAERTVAAWQQYVQPDPEAVPLLADLSGQMTLGLISNFDHPPHVRRVLDEAGLGRYLDTVVVSADVGVKKPDPRIFAVALERVGLPAAEVAFVGDAPEDIAGAVAAGLVPVRIERDRRSSFHQASDYRPGTPAAAQGWDPSHRCIRRLGELRSLLSERGA